MQLKKK